MNLLAKSCFAPGLISIMTNLIASTGTVDEEQFEEDWIKDYAQGREHEIYRVPLHLLFEGKTFQEIVHIIYTEIRAITFALEIENNLNPIIVLNPSDYKVKNLTQ